MIDDKIAQRIEAFDAANGGGVGWYEDKGAYRLYLLRTETPIARLKPATHYDKLATNFLGTISLVAAVTCDMRPDPWVSPFLPWRAMSIGLLRP